MKKASLKNTTLYTGKSKVTAGEFVCDFLYKWEAKSLAVILIHCEVNMKSVTAETNGCRWGEQDLVVQPAVWWSCTFFFFSVLTKKDDDDKTGI